MVLVATAAQILKSGFLDPSAIFLPSVGIIFMVTGLLHPNEMLNLLHGFLYLVTIPGGYLLLVTYALCNLHVVSWGTRETVEVVKKKPTNRANGAAVVQSGRDTRYAHQDGNASSIAPRFEQASNHGSAQRHVLGWYQRGTIAWFHSSDW